MNLKKYELCLVAAALLISGFCVGYFTGRGNKDHVISVGTREITVETSKAQDSNDEKEPAQPEDEPLVSSDDGDLDLTTVKVNINEATTAELVTLPGIGEVLAGRIIEYREEHGGFNAPEDILDVVGIGESKYDTIKDMITVHRGGKR